MMDWVEEFARFNTDWQMQFFKFGLGFLRELLAAYIIGFEKSKLTDRQLHFAKQLHSVMDGEMIDILRHKLEEGILALERNVNSKILMTAHSLYLMSLIKREKSQKIIH